jgi:hypothetical protein
MVPSAGIRDITYYIFKSKNYVDNFFERTAGLTDVGFDKAI